MAVIPQIAILSYPRSGNHLVRYLVEFLSGQATLGCSRRDPPIHVRPNVQCLGHVRPSPIAMKSHWSSGVPGKVEKLILILRSPEEAILSHRRYMAEGDGYLNTAKRDASRIISNLKFFERFPRQKLLIKYEDLVYGDPTEILKGLAALVDAPASMMHLLINDFGKYAEDSRRAPRRKSVSTGSGSFHVDRLSPEEHKTLVEEIRGVLQHPLLEEHYGPTL